MDFGKRMLGSNVAHLSVSPADRDRLDAFADDLRFRNNEVIFTERMQARYVYFLSAGVVRRHSTHADGRRHVVEYAVPGDFLVAPQCDRKAFGADAIGDVVVKRFVRSRFLQLAELSPELTSLITKFTVRELDLARHKLMLLGRATPEERLLAFLLVWQERLAHGATDSTEVLLPMKRHDIADYLGMNFETVSRALSKLQRDSVIVVRRERIRFIDRQRAASLGGTAVPLWLRRDDAAR
jgi:CRP/FNR family transcriptional regulator